MERWIVYAIISMLFAGFTAVIAKQGLTGITAELGLTVRTLFVCVFIMLFGLISISSYDLKFIQKSNYIWLALSAATTALSWIFYYKALKMGDVSTIALIDKGSVVVSVLLAWWLLKEAITLRVVIGAILIVCGMIVISKK